MPKKTVEWDPEEAGKSGYDHYMLKEINEQPRAIRNCVRGRVDEMTGSVSIKELDADLDRPERIHLVACGTSYHASLYAARLFRNGGIPATTFYASEYDASAVPIDEKTLVIGVTQSGETADTLGALRAANNERAETLTVTNVVGSSASRETDHVMYIRAGPEISVARNDLRFPTGRAMLSSTLTGECSHKFVEGLRALPDQIQSILDSSPQRKSSTPTRIRTRTSSSVAAAVHRWHSRVR